MSSKHYRANKITDNELCSTVIVMLHTVENREVSILFLTELNKIKEKVTQYFRNLIFLPERIICTQLFDLLILLNY